MTPSRALSRYLFAHWDGGGNTPPALAVAAGLVARGHGVRLIADPALQAQAEGCGLGFTPWREAPHTGNRLARHDPLRDWEDRTPIGLASRLRHGLMYAPAARYADETLAALRAHGADAVLVTDPLYGAMVAAEASGLPWAVLVLNIVTTPAPGRPPFGLGLIPARSPIARLRDVLLGAAVELTLRPGLPALNAARARHELPRLRSSQAQGLRAGRTIALTSRAFDFPDAATDGVVYAGAMLDDPPWAVTTPTVPLPPGHLPLVLVSLSTTYMAQAPLLQRICDALGRLPVRGLVTTGPAVAPQTLRLAPNTVAVERAPHAALLPQAAAVVTHAGHGTVMRALAAGKPLLCIPMGRDQHDTAARVVFHGAGRRLQASAGTSVIASALRSVLDDERLHAAARALGESIRRECDETSLWEALAALTRREPRP